MLNINKQQGGKNGLAPFSKAGLLLAGILTLGMAVGCSDGSESETVAEPAASESVATEPAAEVVEPEEAAEPEAEAATEVEASTDAAAAAPLSAEAGAELYESHCKQCHEKGLLSAPKFGNTTDWAPRIAKGKETLYKHSAEGFKAMPPQAINGVTVEQVHAAVDYMVEQASES
ncbi:c-type cytochrome [Psychrobacter piechaudii]|uniref:Cytochrome c-555 n=1 Tax=Psychrobacter piechaudii TaxID=1945521 RepID=A0A1R4GSH9_9GAMM|nr:c-type cytochrome [Psychrobacter piechaudii]SJM71055.1 Cytochrome c-555 precursor [Psychrobacter piechaudii]